MIENTLAKRQGPMANANMWCDRRRRMVTITINNGRQANGFENVTATWAELNTHYDLNNSNQKYFIIAT